MEEMQSHLQEGEAPERDTLADAGAEGASGEQPTDPQSETVHPEAGQAEGDEQIFHEEGGRKFATKEEFIAFYRQQRGAASILAREKKRLEQDFQLAQAELARTKGQAQTTPQPKSQEEEEVDEQYRAAVERVKRVGKLATLDEVTELKKQLQEIAEERQNLRQESARKQVETFVQANPDVVEYQAEIADLVKEHNLTLQQAYTLFFGKPPKDAAPKGSPAREAYQKGKATAIKQAQAGGSSSPKSGEQPGGEGQFFDWSLI